jgi:magnesium chelatase family protein
MNLGLSGQLVEVEVDILRGLPAFFIVGLGDSAVQESKKRIHSAIKNSGFSYPQQKKVINLAPANLRKHGPQFDLPMAVGLLVTSGQSDTKDLQNTLLLGELALDGSVRPVAGVLTAALFAREKGWENLLIPSGNYHEAALVKGINILTIDHLKDLPQIFTNGLNKSGKAVPGHRLIGSSVPEGPNFNDINGQETAKRALQIAAGGGHHVALSGSPGIGKTLLAKALPGILPPLSEQEMFEVMQIHSAAGLLARQIMTRRPFRQVHPSSTAVALTGGGPALKPGEISLAHRGVLFMDELPEFPRAHIEHLRQPLEDKTIQISRAAGAITYPAQFTLIAGMNPCPCGYHKDPDKECVCKPYQVIQYRKKISGPILDRIDLFVEVQREPAIKFQEKTASTPLSEIKKRIIRARSIQRDRFKALKIQTNCEMGPQQVNKFCRLNRQCKNLLAEADQTLKLSGRQYHQIIKIARTIADLNQQDQIGTKDIAEALQYRKRKPI